MARCSWDKACPAAGDGVSPAWFVALGCAPVPGALGRGDSGSVGLRPAQPSRAGCTGCRGARGLPAGMVQAPRPLSPLLQGTSVATFWEPEELRHS